jgi:uncharacterized damage-inducible protein DinB
MNHATTRHCTRALTAFGLITFFNAPLAAQEHGHTATPVAHYMEDFEAMESKFLDLADAMSAEQYAWRPMEGVRSVSEVFMLIAAENYMIPAFWDAVPPEGMTVEPALWGQLRQVTEKDQVIEHLKKSYAYYNQALAHVTAEQLHEKIDFFGQEKTVNDAIFLIAGDAHEHLGQAIAYARMNKVVPPWTARAQAGQ